MRLLDEVIAEPAPGLVAIYGRRRVGKTFLVRRATAKVLKFELTGVKDANLREQLENFSSALATASAGKFTGVPRSWEQAFDLLAKWFGTLPREEKHVLFMDELPWLASPRLGPLLELLGLAPTESRLDRLWVSRFLDDSQTTP